MSIRAAFVEAFSEEDATAIEAAAVEHLNAAHDDRGSDPFKWALSIAIGYECMGRFAEYHGVSADEDDIKAWVFEHGDLASHDGDCDYFAMMAGAYDGWVKPEADDAPSPTASDK